MTFSRRRFLEWTMGTAAALATGCAGSRPAGRAPAPGQTAAKTGPAPDTADTAAPAAGRPSTLLILGGTGFLGPHVVEHARARGFRITLFNRGKTNPHLFPDLEQLRGDRDGDLGALAGRTWDAVLDTSGYVPRIVRASAALLAPSVGHYVFISSISVYAETTHLGIDEDHPVARLDDETSEDVSQHYGALKALCEGAAEAAMPGRTASVRPGLIVGPGDTTDRFTYWPVRLARGGEVVAPGTGNDPVQQIDVRDLAAWLVHLVEQRQMGVYNAVGPAEPMTMRAMLERSRAAVGSDASLTWVDADFLGKHGVTPWGDMPAWTPAGGEYAGFGAIDASKAMKHGLRFRPIEDTATATLAWFRSLPADRQTHLRAGITPEREAAVLAAWHGRSGATPS